MGGVIDFVADCQEILVDLLELADDAVKVCGLGDRAEESGGQGEGVAQHLNPVGDDGDLVVEVFVDQEGENNSRPVDEEENGDSSQHWHIELGQATWSYPINGHYPEETKDFRVEFVKVAESLQLTHGGGICY